MLTIHEMPDGTVELSMARSAGTPVYGVWMAIRTPRGWDRGPCMYPKNRTRYRGLMVASEDQNN